AIAVILIIVGGYFLFFKKPPSYQFISVKQGSITESVSLTGNTTSQQAVSLAFGSSGTVSQTFRSLGTKVTAGKVLAELNMSDLVAQLHNAEAGLVLAKQQASASKNNVENVTAQQDSLVSSAYQNFLNSTIEAVPKDPSKGYPAPIISGNYILRREGKIDLHFYYSTGGISFEVSGLTEGTGLNNTVTSQPIGNSGLYLKGVSSQIDTPDWVIEIPNKKAANYLTNYNAYQQALDNRDKAIADAQASVGVDQSAVSQAQIEQAQAGVDGILAKIQNAKIVAPISGTITQFDAKVGQLATAGTPLISIISDEGYEVDAGVSETDVGKILVGNKVSMGLDAFPNEVFTGSVFYIAPAETNTQGVISYQLKIAFDKQDPRLKSGLTANADIETRNKDNVLILPQYAILQNDSGTFVEILENGAVKDVPVTLGIQDQQGNVEVLSGVTLAEQVLNIGLKVK
ncbi:TPA: hypothetical protein DCQ44_00155, partial [Candidatus Taylorbacteria bacterium]|nr:hypothetical protein [Candidatus Taylorbacteria bacterium]